MPRKLRAYLPEIPCHIIQRGNDRQACFYAEADYQYYLECLNDAALPFGVDIHAYVLMTNHVHLLMTPREATGISRVMQSLGRRYVQYINRKYRRTGTLWEGRHKSSLIEADAYLLACYRYIELNPVRARMVNHPAEYRWSSYKYNADGEASASPTLTPHPIYLALSQNREDRERHYRALFDVNENETRETNKVIRCASSCSMPIGGHRFREQIEGMLERRLGKIKRGRPLRGNTSKEE